MQTLQNVCTKRCHSGLPCSNLNTNGCVEKENDVVMVPNNSSPVSSMWISELGLTVEDRSIITTKNWLSGINL